MNAEVEILTTSVNTARLLGLLEDETVDKNVITYIFASGAAATISQKNGRQLSLDTSFVYEVFRNVEMSKFRPKTYVCGPLLR